MTGPIAVAIYYAIVAWLGCWEIDLISIVFRGPLLVDPVAKFIVVTICLIIVLIAGSRVGFMLHGA